MLNCKSKVLTWCQKKMKYFSEPLLWDFQPRCAFISHLTNLIRTQRAEEWQLNNMSSEPTGHVPASMTGSSATGKSNIIHKFRAWPSPSTLTIQPWAGLSAYLSPACGTDSDSWLIYLHSVQSSFTTRMHLLVDKQPALICRQEAVQGLVGDTSHKLLPSAAPILHFLSLGRQTHM